MFRRILVGDLERVFVIRKRRFERILGPGEYWVWTFGRAIRFERHDIREIALCSEWADYLAKNRPEDVARYFTVVETAEFETAVVYIDGRVVRVVGPGTRALYWRGAGTVAVDLFNARLNAGVPQRLVPALVRFGRESQATFAVVEEGRRGVLYVEGRAVRELEPGSYAFWNAAGSPRVDVIDIRSQSIEVPGQEILTRDKVTLRVNIHAAYEIADATLSRSAVRDLNEQFYRTLQVAVRQTLSRRTLEEVLAERVSIDETVSSEVRTTMAAFGVRVGEIAIRDIILPGDIRDILNQVVAAEKQAQANLIRRREETAATRSLLNTAKLMEDNPLLVRMKELETLEKLAEKVDKITVLGGFDELLERTVTLSSK